MKKLYPKWITNLKVETKTPELQIDRIKYLLYNKMGVILAF
jgi:hypothetical protein